MNITNFVVTGNNFKWKDLAHNGTIRFEIEKGCFIECKIEKDSTGAGCLSVRGASYGSLSALTIKPEVSNSIKVALVK